MTDYVDLVERPTPEEEVMRRVDPWLTLACWLYAANAIGWVAYIVWRSLQHSQS